MARISRYFSRSGCRKDKSPEAEADRRTCGYATDGYADIKRAHCRLMCSTPPGRQSLRALTADFKSGIEDSLLDKLFPDDQRLGAVADGIFVHHHLLYVVHGGNVIHGIEQQTFHHRAQTAGAGMA